LVLALRRPRGADVEERPPTGGVPKRADEPLDLLLRPPPVGDPRVGHALLRASRTRITPPRRETGAARRGGGPPAGAGRPACPAAAGRALPAFRAWAYPLEAHGTRRAAPTAPRERRTPACPPPRPRIWSSASTSSAGTTPPTTSSSPSAA